MSILRFLIVAGALLAGFIVATVFAQEPEEPAQPSVASQTQTVPPGPPPMPIIMFEQGAIPVRFHTLRVDQSVRCSMQEPGVLFCTAKKASGAAVNPPKQ